MLKNWDKSLVKRIYIKKNWCQSSLGGRLPSLKWLLCHGALGAKMSGGGLGGCIIALVANLDQAQELAKRIRRERSCSDMDRKPVTVRSYANITLSNIGEEEKKERNEGWFLSTSSISLTLSMYRGRALSPLPTDATAGAFISMVSFRVVQACREDIEQRSSASLPSRR